MSTRMAENGGKEYSTLVKFDKNYLCISVTSASFERVFSTTGNIVGSNLT